MAEGRDAQEVELLARAAAGDRAAFAALVQTHQAYLRQFLRRLSRGQSDWADELAQEAFLAAWRGLPGFRGEARFRSWLTRLALNLYLRQRDSQPPVDALDEPPEGADSDFAPAAGLRLDLARALAQLREPEREAILMCFYADLSHAEAAAALGWPLGTLKTQVLRGRARLRELLGEPDMNDEELDLLLRADAAAGPEDAGFTQRLMARVADAVAAPAPKPRPASNRLPQRMAQLAALSIALFGFCLLWPSVSDAWSHAQSGGESALGGAVLLCLVVWWTLPQARSNPWR